MFHSCNYDMDFCMGHGFADQCGTCGRNVKLFQENLIDFSRMKIIDPTARKAVAEFDEDGKAVKKLVNAIPVSSKCVKYMERY